MLYEFIFYFFLILLNSIFIKQFHMGCESSQPVYDGKNQKNEVRKKKKKADKIVGRQSTIETILENVVELPQKITQTDHRQIANFIAPHFFFSSFSENERIDIAQQMKLYKCAKAQYIFKQSDPGSLFFIIKKGQVAIQINGNTVKEIGAGAVFGELSLLYTAPRSASVLTLTDCVFWCLHQTVFRRHTEQQIKKNYKIARPLLEKVPLFQYLSKSQLNSIAYSMNTLKYVANDVIFKEGDDSNSFYIIMEGQATVTIKQKETVILDVGQSFGDNLFKKSEVRRGTVVAGPAGVKVLSIGKEGLKNCLGGRIDELIQHNILKQALKCSKIFANISDDLIEKFLLISETKQFSDNEIICRKKEPLRYLLVSVQGKIEQYESCVLINEDYFLIPESNADKQIYLKSNLKKYGKGDVIMLPIKKIEALCGFNLIEATRKNLDIFKEIKSAKKVVMTLTQSIVNRKRPNLTINDLNFVRELGSGQFGKVYLVKNRANGVRYALKCISKKIVAEWGLQKLVDSQKDIMAYLNHPLIVRLEQSFEDEHYIFLLMQYIDGMDFFDLLRQIGLCNQELSSFYVASLILCFEELHTNNIVYRDLKPENSVVDSKGYLYLIDLGTAKRLSEEKGSRTFTIIGTPHYMAPEIIEGKGYGLAVDIWSLGVMFYEMVCGKLPFGEDLEDPYAIYKHIVGSKIQFPNYYFNKKGRAFIQRLLERNSLKRQIQDFSQLKTDPFFDNFRWQDLCSKKLKPPFAPKVKKQSLTKKQQPILKYLSSTTTNNKTKKSDAIDVVDIFV